MISTVYITLTCSIIPSTFFHLALLAYYRLLPPTTITMDGPDRKKRKTDGEYSQNAYTKKNNARRESLQGEEFLRAKAKTAFNTAVSRFFNQKLQPAAAPLIATIQDSEARSGLIAELRVQCRNVLIEKQ